MRRNIKKSTLLGGKETKELDKKIELEKMDVSLRQKTSELEQKQLGVSKAESELVAKTTKLQKFESEYQVKQTSLAELNKELGILEGKKLAILASIEGAKKEVDEKMSAYTIDWDNKLNNAKTELANLEGKLLETNKKIKEIEQELLVITQKRDTLLTEVKKFEDRRSSLQVQVSELEKRIIDLDKKYSSQIEGYTNYEQKITDKQVILDQLVIVEKEKNETLKEQNKVILGKEKEIKTVQEKLVNIQAEYDSIVSLQVMVNKQKIKNDEIVKKLTKYAKTLGVNIKFD